MIDGENDTRIACESIEPKISCEKYKEKKRGGQRGEIINRKKWMLSSKYFQI